MDIQILDQTVLIRLDVTFWTGRAKMQVEDLPDDVRGELPPNQLSTLGTKRIFDPAKLRVFNMLKGRAHGLLRRSCVSLMGGYATHINRLPDLCPVLGTIAQEFNDAVRDFALDYVQSSAEWAANFPEWSHILLNALPKAHEIAKRFSFTWQVYQIHPVQYASAFDGNDQADTLSNLEGSVMEEISTELKVMLRDTIGDRETATKKTYRPLQPIIDKVRALAFIHPHLVSLEKVLVEAQTMAHLNPDCQVTLRLIRNFLTALSTPEGVHAICMDHADTTKTMAEIFDPFWATTLPPVEQPAVPQLPPGWPFKAGVIQDVGLW